MDPSEYYKVRLDHTIQHTQQSTRMIYLVNGGILALLYFVAQLPAWPIQHCFLVIIIWVLAFINFFHVALIIRQRDWYSNIDDAFKMSIAPSPSIVGPTGFPWVGTHNLYAGLHAVITILLVATGIALLRYPNLLPKASGCYIS